MLKQLDYGVAMKTSLNHLPDLKQREIKEILKRILDASDKVEMVILFGSYARGDWREEVEEKDSRYWVKKSDYDLLVGVTDEAACEDRTLLDVERAILKAHFSTHARIIIHDMAFINEKLRRGQYFFSEIKEQGILLYDSKRLRLEKKRQLPFREVYENAQHYFKAWLKSSEGFWKIYKFCMGEKEFNKAGFNMHQACESLYKTFLLVYTDYSPKGHYLSDLGEMAGEYKFEMDRVFPKQTEEERKRFERLDYSYIGSRYDMSFKMTQEELKTMEPYVEKLFELTKQFCEERLQELKAQV